MRVIIFITMKGMTTMYNEIIDILNHYIKNNKDIDCSFVNDIVDIAIKNYNLEEYITHVAFSNQNLSLGYPEASFYISDKKLCFFLEPTKEEIRDIIKEFPIVNKNKSFKFLFALNVLFHEIEHARQQLKINQNSDLESIILNAEYEPQFKLQHQRCFCNLFKAIKLQSLIDKHYWLSPSERMAEISGCNISKEIAIKMDDVISKDVLEYFEFTNLLRGYCSSSSSGIINAPTKFYLKKVNPKYDYSKITLMSKEIDNDITLMRLGLEVSKEGIKEVENKRKVLLRRINK